MYCFLKDFSVYGIRCGYINKFWGYGDKVGYGDEVGYACNIYFFDFFIILGFFIKFGFGKENCVVIMMDVIFLFSLVFVIF